MPLNSASKKHPLTYLSGWEVVFLSLILFGSFILMSNLPLFTPATHLTGKALSDPHDSDMVFTSGMNWLALIKQGLLMALALAYLRFRRFDFSQWTIRLTGPSLVKTIVIFLVLALVFDLYQMVIYFLQGDGFWPYQTFSIQPIIDQFKSFDLSLILYSAFNGFYEELFFLGICLSVRPQQEKWAFLYSLIIRYAFHTYQGQVLVVGISLIFGCGYYWLYKKMSGENLLAFMVPMCPDGYIWCQFIIQYYGLKALWADLVPIDGVPL